MTSNWTRPLFTGRSLIAIATYNEIETLPCLIEEILHVLPAADVLVVDDNSPDGTGRWCEQRAASEPRLRSLHRPAKLGLGTATLAAFRFAIERGFEVVVTLDADGSHDPRHLPSILAAASQADVVIGSRYCDGGAIDGWPLGRRVVSKMVNAAGRSLLRLPVRDTSGAYRAYRVALLRELDLGQMRSPGYAFLEELLWHLARRGARFAEVPIAFRRRRGGRSKAGIREAIGKITTIGKLAGREALGRWRSREADESSPMISEDVACPTRQQH
jgi:dolichol-phosphate mannosyltransferase